MSARILLVEDDPVSREVLATLLASRGHEVETADDGFRALCMARETAYDLVFIDYHLPEMDGYALARLMHSLGETTNRKMKMVAITADRFGLTARRNVDTMFDRVLAKPIEPDTLFAFVDECFGEPEPLADLEEFLAPEPSLDGPQNAGLMLWRARGLSALPTARVFPAPLPSERERLSYCFDIVEHGTPDCILLLRASGLAGVEEWRAKESAYLQPLFVINPEAALIGDVHFQVGDGASWSNAASALKRFADMRRGLKEVATHSSDLDIRLLAYMFVADRSLKIIRDPSGQTIVPYTGGFSTKLLIDVVKRLAARGFVCAKLDTSNGERHLVVSLTTSGYAFVLDDTKKGLGAAHSMNSAS